MLKGNGGKKMEIQLSRSVWQVEPPFDNVMHRIMCTVLGSLRDAQKTSVVPPAERGEKKRRGD